MTGLALAASLHADDNVREVQEKLRDNGFYLGEIDGAYSSDLSAALSRYQIRNGLPITGQLDVETSKALGAKPAVGPSTSASEQSSSETWRRLRKAERRTVTSTRRSETAAAEARETSSPRIDEAAGTSTETANETQEKSATTTSAPQSQDSSSTRTNDEPTGTTTEARPQSAAAATAPISSETTEPAAAPSAIDSIDEFSTERLRDYVAAFVLAGLDKNVGAETEFFADRVEYYDQGSMNHDQIREDLKRYDERWPERHFWVAGKINIEPQTENRVRVTFPLGFKLRNGNRQSSGKVDKTLVLERAGDDLQIVAVGEVSESKK
jgi:peptidoglycan hydrolase-like protein with peptidoglycan-binding domain